MSSKAVAPAVTAEDRDLVVQVRAGDPAAFTLFFRRFSPYVAGVACRLLGGDADVDDIVQETFVTASERIEDLRSPESVRHWLAAIAVRKTYQRLRGRRRRQRMAQVWTAAAPRASNPAVSEPVRSLYQALDQMPDKLRVPWVLHRIEREVLSDVARVCGTSLATAKRRIARAEAMLSRRLYDRR